MLLPRPIPKGVRVYLPPQAALKREIETKLLPSSSVGVQEIVTQASNIMTC
jgi:hypothetical protein